ncbi:MAG: Penicillin-binding protein 4* [Planctomycetes bacterium ADurb.Bin412]|nr:MAG: Penicillin-binding protein 4* [Planctomycetes bacterium ADurb.Bin412]
MIEPFREPMSPDTIFDLASVSKPVGTATSILILRDRGKIGLEDPVGRYLPAFAGNGKEKAQIRHLLGHTSGLPAYTNAAALKKQYGESCPDRVVEKICGLQALSEPGETRRYSCLGYIVLGKIVEVVSGQNIAQFAQETIFQPLGMNHTAYTPPREWEDDIAATQMYEGRLRRGWVHDPLAQLNGGISGNAGLFSRAADLAIYCRMLLQGGEYGGVRILSPEAVQLLTRPQRENQAYGFEFPRDYSWLQDEEAGKRCFGHTGYTGTEVMCDPIHGIYLILLTNRVHPHDEGKVQPLRVRVAAIIAEALASKFHKI